GAEGERVDAAVRRETLVGVGHVGRRPGGEDLGHEPARELALGSRYIAQLDPRERPGAAARLDLGLDRRLRERGRATRARVEAREQLFGQQELAAIEVAGQSDATVAALVAVDLRAAEGDALAAPAAETQVEVGAGQDHLVRRRRRVAAQ